MKTERPVTFTISLPLVAFVSFSHRITGIALFVGVAFGLYALNLALASPAGFAEAAALVDTPFAMFIFLGLLFVLIFHMLAGIKHLLMDFHIGDSFPAAHTGSIIVLVVSGLVTAGLGVTLW